MWSGPDKLAEGQDRERRRRSTVNGPMLEAHASLWLNDVITDRKLNNIGKRVPVQLAHNRRPVRLHGFDA
jgi:hypothetical protein